MRARLSGQDARSRPEHRRIFWGGGGVKAKWKAYREWDQKVGFAWGLWRRWVKRREVAADLDIDEARKEPDDE